MRLKHIKLAGFKSFVDPTTVSFPSNLCAVVGPNGCGKSNIIDAVRWVMGESSAKNLRGESMTDVIFNGSTSRKPIGQASIELVFDNSDGTLKGEYASFTDISIRRKVTRDAQNIYYLNGSKCRRRDIVDIFLGTGLGPRSYSIIEQGMISRLIESKPEELRVYIEEAAGISKYKERRRDTENRMRRTKENLERLSDIREELERQLSRLERQAKSAEKYTELKKEEREIKAQLNSLRYRLLDEESKAQQRDISERELKIEAFVTERVSHDTAIEKHRAVYSEQGDVFNEIQGRFYSIGNEIARIEQSIQYIQERNRQLQSDLAQVESDSQETSALLDTDGQQIEAWQIELAEIEPELELLRSVETDSGSDLLEAEENMQVWQQEWDEFNQSAAEPRHRAEVEQSRIQHLEQVQTRLLERIARLKNEAYELSEVDESEDVPLLQETLSEVVLQREEIEQNIDAVLQTIATNREASVISEELLNEQRNQLQQLRGRHASLEALQQAAVSGGRKLDDWLALQALDAKPRLWSQLTVDSDWQKSVEMVLGDALQALCIDGIDAVTEVLDSLEQGSLVLLDTNASTALNAQKNYACLTEKVSGQTDISNLLAGIYTADDLASALAMRHLLGPSESVITPEGIWLGASWLRVKREADSEASVLARQKELESANALILNLEADVEGLVASLYQSREAERQAESLRESLRVSLDEKNLYYHQQQSQISSAQLRVESEAQRRQQLAEDVIEAKEQMDIEDENLSQARLILQDAIASMESDTDRKEALLVLKDNIRLRLDSSRQRARQDKDTLHAQAMRHQSIKTQLQSIMASVQRLEEQKNRLVERRNQLLSTIGEGDDPTEDHRLELEALLEKRIYVEDELMTARRQVEVVEQQLRDSEQGRARVENDLQALRGQLTEYRLTAQTVQVKRETIAKQLLEDGSDLEHLLASLPDDAAESLFEEEVELIHNRISRLGPINLAAIDEYKVESERKNYLDTQDEDLREALATLENAILKIDKETRTRFKETFDAVNKGIQELFPKVFGGGHAYLELTGDDLLDTGVTIMARPPGKRNSTIHLLSGGEKALTAIALVFSIFRLNPAPFCMLDEVDAPLDDANVGRYAKLVQEMAEHVQFIYITHNKIAMEMAQQLMGVTMYEPGVSRMVTVDVAEAAELAAV
jgi:chromosome segregation protein